MRLDLPWVLRTLTAACCLVFWSSGHSAAQVFDPPSPTSGDRARNNEPGHRQEDDRISPSDRFGRMFNLPPFAPASPSIKAALVELGRRGGLMDAADDLGAGAVALIVDPALSANNPNNDTHTAGVTFVGQFLDHDMTFDTSSRLGAPTNPEQSANARRPFFDLDSVYGSGPAGSPLLYDPADRAKFRVESGGIFEDVPRESDGRAIIADPRNDESVVIAGLQAAFLLFHNHVVDLVRNQRPDLAPSEIFAQARQLTTWHYQWMIVHEFLPQFVGLEVVNDVLQRGPMFYRPGREGPFIPVEFQIAYRFGHSMVRPSYRANFTGLGGAPLFALLFDPSQSGSPDPTDLRGGVRGPRRFIGWTTFFRFPGFEEDVRPNKRIDTHLSSPLFDLPLGAIASGEPPSSLAERNLLRHLTWQLPSGQAIAEAMGLPVVPAEQLADLGRVHPRFVTSTPLWYYVLKEAEVFTQGTRLGPVGGRIVAEVFLGLLQLDPDSYLNAAPGFSPLFARVPGTFQMTDFLTFAGVAGRR
jgi:Animal haem peroxidase